MIAAALALLVAQVQLDPAATLAQVAAAPIVLAAGTPVRLVTLEPISSRSAVQGQRFPLQVAEDVSIGGLVVIPRGTPAIGEVDAVSGTGMFGKAAKLVLEPLFVDIGGRRVNLVGATEERGRKAVTEAALATLITPLGLAITGKSAKLPARAPLFARVRSDVAFDQR